MCNGLSVVVVRPMNTIRRICHAGLAYPVLIAVEGRLVLLGMTAGKGRNDRTTEALTEVDDIVLCAILKLDNPQLGLFPMDTVLRRGVAYAESPVTALFPIGPRSSGLAPYTA